MNSSHLIVIAVLLVGGAASENSTSAGSCQASGVSYDVGQTVDGSIWRYKCTSNNTWTYIGCIYESMFFEFGQSYVNESLPKKFECWSNGTTHNYRPYFTHCLYNNEMVAMHEIVDTATFRVRCVIASDQLSYTMVTTHCLKADGTAVAVGQSVAAGNAEGTGMVTTTCTVNDDGTPTLTEQETQN